MVSNARLLAYHTSIWVVILCPNVWNDTQYNVEKRRLWSAQTRKSAAQISTQFSTQFRTWKIVNLYKVDYGTVTQ